MSEPYEKPYLRKLQTGMMNKFGFRRENYVRRLDRRIHVGLRINLDAGIAPQWSRFGFNLESGQAHGAARRIAAGGRLVLNGLHCHIGTYILDPKAYAVLAQKMVAFAYSLKDDLDCDIEYFDVGGGFPSRARLKGTYLPAEACVPALEDYAEALCDSFLRHLRPGDFPRLILETGRAIVDEAGYLITTVHAVKRLPHSGRAYVLDAG